MRGRFMITAKIGCAIVAGLALAAHAQSQCPSSDAVYANMYDRERERHGDRMTILKNARDQILAEQHVAYNNCPRGDNDCRRAVREKFAPRLAEVKNEETLENSRHRQEERKIGQFRRDCKLDERVERRSKPR